MELQDDGKLSTSDDPPVVFGSLDEEFIQKVVLSQPRTNAWYNIILNWHNITHGLAVERRKYHGAIKDFLFVPLFRIVFRY